MSPQSKSIRVEGKEPGTPHYASSFVVYPEKSVPVGGTWQYRETPVRGAAVNLVDDYQCTLVGRESFRGEEVWRIQCGITYSSVPRDKLSVSGTGTLTALVRLSDGTLMNFEEKSQSSSEVPGKKEKQASGGRFVLEEEAPAATGR